MTTTRRTAIGLVAAAGGAGTLAACGGDGGDAGGASGGGEAVTVPVAEVPEGGGVVRDRVVVTQPRRIAALAGLVALFFLGGMAGALGYLWLGFEVVVPVAAVLLLIAHRSLVQDLREAWLRRRPRRPSGRGPRSAR